MCAVGDGGVSDVAVGVISISPRRRSSPSRIFLCALARASLAIGWSSNRLGRCTVKLYDVLRVSAWSLLLNLCRAVSASGLPA